MLDKLMSLVDMLIPAANAASTAATTNGGSALGPIITLAGFILIFYFLIWRPQSKRSREHRDLVDGLQDGDEVITTGGVLGRVMQIQEDGFMKLNIADAVNILIQKNAVSSVVPKGTLKAK